MPCRMALVCIGFFMFLAGNAAAEETAWISALNGLRLRALPSERAELVAVLAFNTPVEVISRQEEYVTVSGEKERTRWVNIKSPQGTGWTIDAYLTRTDQGIPPDHPILANVRSIFNAMRDHQPLAPYMNKNGIVVVHQSSTRCEGNAYGVRLIKPPQLIDRPFSIHVVSDGEGWEECDRHLKPRAYALKIDVAEWISKPMAENRPVFSFDQEGKRWNIQVALSLDLTFGFVEDRGRYYVNRIVLAVTDPG
jgi:hypothetical protein